MWVTGSGPGVGVLMWVTGSGPGVGVLMLSYSAVSTMPGSTALAVTGAPLAASCSCSRPRGSCSSAWGDNLQPQDQVLRTRSSASGPGPQDQDQELLPALQVVQLQLSRVVSGRRHVDDPGSGAVAARPRQRVQQQVGEQEVAQVVEREVELEAVLRPPLGDHHGPGCGPQGGVQGQWERGGAPSVATTALPLFSRTWSGRPRATKLRENCLTHLREVRSKNTNSTGTETQQIYH
ncbi:hypothetical protein EYF80_050510 [Liparis tanakae]|uniref:Uncharacterized protein n=1 Tax=Liparis tanakae TaxID=230148 RepID=A0A4Z2FEK1_9TELE|nr:hypothetical protein EYF80_050510 [Liparis tanakae]